MWRRIRRRRHQQLELGAATSTTTASNTYNLNVLAGVSGGEGCSTAGGCATCPFMKMNDLDAVQDIIEMISSSTTNNNNTIQLELQPSKHLPPNRLEGKTIEGRDAIDLGTEPILMKSKMLSEELVTKIESGGMAA